MIYPTLYKLDTKGKIRLWHMEQDGANFRAWDGVQGGKIKCSEWKLAEATNDNRANARTAEEQAAFEIEAIYKRKSERDYHYSIDDIEEGSRIFEVMLCEKYKPEKFEAGFLNPKLDGFRCIINKDGMWSRNGKPFVSSPHIFEELESLFSENPDLILDGELYNHELRDDFNEIQSLITVKTAKKLTPDMLNKTKEMVQYHIYDIPSHRGTYNERSQALEDTFAVNNFISIRPVETTYVSCPESYDAFHEEWIEAGYEGSIWRKDSVYENRRTKALLKRKDFDDAEFEVVRIEEGKGNWAGAAKRVVCWLPGADKSVGPNPDNTFEAGIRGTRDRGKELLNEKHDIVTIRYFGWTPSKIPKPRFGVATAFHGKARDF